MFRSPYCSASNGRSLVLKDSTPVISYCLVQLLASNDASDKEVSIILSKEAERISKYINDDAVKVPLCIEGAQMTSEGFSEFFTKQENSSVSHLQFIIGGSLGMSDEIKKLGSTKLSFSKMTFPHQLMRVVLLEQIYRAYRIKNNEPYHK